MKWLTCCCVKVHFQISVKTLNNKVIVFLIRNIFGFLQALHCKHSNYILLITMAKVQLYS